MYKQRQGASSGHPPLVLGMESDESSLDTFSQLKAWKGSHPEDLRKTERPPHCSSGFQIKGLIFFFPSVTCLTSLVINGQPPHLTFFSKEALLNSITNYYWIMVSQDASSHSLPLPSSTGKNTLPYGAHMACSQLFFPELMILSESLLPWSILVIPASPCLLKTALLCVKGT